MTARFLMAIFDSAFVLALAAWVGSLLFFMAAVSPATLKVLETDPGERFRRALSRRLYTWGTVCGAIALPSAMAVPLSFPEYRAPRVGVQALVIIAATLIMLYAGNSLTPAIKAAQDAGPGGREHFVRLQRRSFWLNGMTLALGIGLLVAFVNRPAPQTAGIVEPSPVERVRLETERQRERAKRTSEPKKSRPQSPSAP